MEIVHQIMHADKVVKVYFDPEPIDPRTYHDNVTIMVHWHPRYNLGDERIRSMYEEDIRAKCEEQGDPILAILPLYLYVHSDLSVSTDAFSCRWDSGQVGWVYITQSKKDKMGFPDTYTLDMYENIIREEVKTYNDYLNGQVFGYEVVGKDGDVLESCWGFVGDMEGCLSQGKLAAESV